MSTYKQYTIKNTVYFISIYPNIDNGSAIYRIGIGGIVTVVWLQFDDEGNFFYKK